MRYALVLGMNNVLVRVYRDKVLKSGDIKAGPCVGTWNINDYKMVPVLLKAFYGGFWQDMGMGTYVNDTDVPGYSYRATAAEDSE